MSTTALAPARRLTLLGTEVFALAAVAMLAITDDGEIVEANDPAAAMLGAQRSTLRQEPIARFIPELGGSALLGQVIAARRGRGNVHAGAMSLQPSDAQPFDVCVVLGALREGVRWPVLLLQLVPLREH